MPDYIKNGVRYADEKTVNTPLDYDSLLKTNNVDAAFITEPVNVYGNKDIYEFRRKVNNGINSGAKQIMPVIAGAAAAPFVIGGITAATAAIPGLSSISSAILRTFNNPTIKYALNAGRNYGRVSKGVEGANSLGQALGAIGRTTLSGAATDLAYENITGNPAQLGNALNIENPVGNFVLNMLSPGSLIGLGLDNVNLSRKIKEFYHYYWKGGDYTPQDNFILSRYKDHIDNMINRDEKLQEIIQSIEKAHPELEGLKNKLKSYKLIFEYINRKNEALTYTYRVTTPIRSVLDQFVSSDVPTIYDEFNNFKALHPNLTEDEVIKEFIDKQLTSIRGATVDTKKFSNSKEALKVLDEASTQVYSDKRSGGDMLDTKGGLYTSNRLDIANNFGSENNNSHDLAEIAVLKFSPENPITTLEQLEQHSLTPGERDFYKYILGEKNWGKLLKQFSFIQDYYGINGATQRAFYPHIQQSSIVPLKVQYKSGPDVANKHGRFGNSSIKQEGDDTYFNYYSKSKDKILSTLRTFARNNNLPIQDNITQKVTYEDNLLKGLQRKSNKIFLNQALLKNKIATIERPINDRRALLKVTLGYNSPDILRYYYRNLITPKLNSGISLATLNTMYNSKN